MSKLPFFFSLHNFHKIKKKFSFPFHPCVLLIFSSLTGTIVPSYFDIWWCIFLSFNAKKISPLFLSLHQKTSTNFFVHDSVKFFFLSTSLSVGARGWFFFLSAAAFWITKFIFILLFFHLASEIQTAIILYMCMCVCECLSK